MALGQLLNCPGEYDSFDPIYISAPYKDVDEVVVVQESIVDAGDAKTYKLFGPGKLGPDGEDVPGGVSYDSEHEQKMLNEWKQYVTEIIGSKAYRDSLVPEVRLAVQQGAQQAYDLFAEIGGVYIDFRKREIDGAFGPRVYSLAEDDDDAADYAGESGSIVHSQRTNARENIRAMYEEALSFLWCVQYHENWSRALSENMAVWDARGAKDSGAVGPGGFRAPKPPRTRFHGPGGIAQPAPAPFDLDAPVPEDVPGEGFPGDEEQPFPDDEEPYPDLGDEGPGGPGPDDIPPDGIPNGGIPADEPAKKPRSKMGTVGIVVAAVAAFLLFGKK